MTLSFFDRLPKDVGVMIYRILHLHKINSLNSEYHKNVAILECGNGEMYKKIVGSECKWNYDSFNWRNFCGYYARADNEDLGIIYKFDGSEVKSKLPKRYYYSTLKSDMIEK